MPQPDGPCPACAPIPFPATATIAGQTVTVYLEQDADAPGANEQIYGGWPMILSGLKTWLETGELLTTPGSLMYR